MNGTRSIRDNKNMSAILITGSEGNIGRFITRDVRKKYPDAKIIRVARNKSVPSASPQDIVYNGDLTDASFIQRIFRENDVEYVIHAAARSYSPAGFKEDAYGLLRHDIQCLLTVLESGHNVKKFVYLSSSTLYESSDEAPFTEDLVDRIPPPKSPYGMAKLIGEKALMLFSKQYAVPYTIWRAFNVVSPLERDKTDGGHVFVDFYQTLLVKKASSLEVFGDGRQVRCFTWVEDVSRIIAENLMSPKTDNQIFNLGSSEPKTLLDLKDVLLELGKEKNIIPYDYNPTIVTGKQFYGVDSKLRIPSTDKLNSVLGPQTFTDFKTCFRKFIEYQKETI